MKKFLITCFLFVFYFLHFFANTFLYPYGVLLTKPLFATQAQTPTSGSYACVLDDVFFCAAPSERTELFLLPKTYYVKILEYDSAYCKVEYLYDDAYSKKLYGYVKTEGLTFVDYVPARPYLYYLFDVSYVIDDSIQDSSFLNQITIRCAYYGDYKIGSKTYCYVLRDDVFGYVPKPSTLVYEENPEYADKMQQEIEPIPDESSKKRTSSFAQIALLIVLCLLVPILAALILKPPKRPPYEPDE